MSHNQRRIKVVHSSKTSSRLLSLFLGSFRVAKPPNTTTRHIFEATAGVKYQCQNISASNQAAFDIRNDHCGFSVKYVRRFRVATV
jgi:hypothetical protein